MVDGADALFGQRGDVLGARLRHARLAHGWRLKDVAARIDCSESLVSKIERGHITPSLKVLHRLTQVLELSINALFATGETDSVVWRRGERPVMSLKESHEGGRIHLERIVPHEPGALLEANIHIVEPGAESDGGIAHNGEEAGYLLEGNLDLWVDETVYHLGPGDAIHFRSDRTHHYRNPGDSVARVLWVNTPPTF